MKLYFYPKKEYHTRRDTDEMIRDALEAYISEHSLTPFEGEILRTSLGKPYVTYPLFVGVSHTDKIVVVGVGKENFGIDCEKIERKISRRDAVAKRFFTNSEIDAFEKSNDRDSAFLNIWVKKEAYVKYTGKGLSAMKNVDVTSLWGFEKIENDKNLIIYLYKDK